MPASRPIAYTRKPVSLHDQPTQAVQTLPPDWESGSLPRPEEARSSPLRGCLPILLFLFVVVPLGLLEMAEVLGTSSDVFMAK